MTYINSKGITIHNRILNRALQGNYIALPIPLCCVHMDLCDQGRTPAGRVLSAQRKPWPGQSSIHSLIGKSWKATGNKKMRKYAWSAPERSKRTIMAETVLTLLWMMLFEIV